MTRELVVGTQARLGDTIVRRKADDEFALTDRHTREGVGLTRDQVREVAEMAGFDVSDPD